MVAATESLVQDVTNLITRRVSHALQRVVVACEV